MTLPVVHSLVECADFESTVTPYLFQLRPLPQTIADSITNINALRLVYLDTNPLVTAFAFALAVSPIFLVVSEVNRNYSQVDRFWSILPSLYNFHYTLYAHLAGVNTARLDVVTLISFVWSARLTFNYWRKGGYSVGSEDYRWVIVKNYTGPTIFFLLNIVFIAFAQNILLFIITTPSYVLLLSSRLASNNKLVSTWDLHDTVAGSLMLTFIVISSVADQQQWDFYSARTKYRNTAKVPAGWSLANLERGFLTQGLFAYSRHPNFAAEQGVWVTLYLWSCLATNTFYNWTGLGAVLYLCLFQASTWLTELLSSSKYPDYKSYQDQVAKFLPLPGAPCPIFVDQISKQANGSTLRTQDAAKARERYNLR